MWTSDLPSRPRRSRSSPTAPPQPVARAVDDRGSDVTDIVRVRDGRYLDTFGRGPYQGITRSHWVEVTLRRRGAQGPGPLYLIATGWIHPTDSSINVAHLPGPPRAAAGVESGSAGLPGPLACRQAGPRVPGGKIKTVVLDLTPCSRPAPRAGCACARIWKSTGITSAGRAGLPRTPLKMRRLAARGADLRYRGFCVTHQADASSPEIPVRPSGGHGPHWLDLVGYYTRFGDVRELLQKSMTAMSS